MVHELLKVGVDFLGFAPIPGLEPAGRALLQIWDTLQQVDVNIFLLFCFFFLSFFLPFIPLLIRNPIDEPNGVPSSDRTMRRHLAFHSRRNPRSRKLRRHRVTRADHKTCRVRSQASSLQRDTHSAPNRAFAHVHAVMLRQVNRPFIKRYLKRDDILRAIQGCDAELNNALNMFSVGVLISFSDQS